jgi:hypothetical protein
MERSSSKALHHACEMLRLWSARYSGPAPPAHPFLSLHLSNSRKPFPISVPLLAGPAAAGGRFLLGPAGRVNIFFRFVGAAFRLYQPLRMAPVQRGAVSTPDPTPCQPLFSPPVSPGDSGLWRPSPLSNQPVRRGEGRFLGPQSQAVNLFLQKSDDPRKGWLIELTISSAGW